MFWILFNSQRGKNIMMIRIIIVISSSSSSSSASFPFPSPSPKTFPLPFSFPSLLRHLISSHLTSPHLISSHSFRAASIIIHHPSLKHPTHQVHRHLDGPINDGNATGHEEIQGVHKRPANGLDMTPGGH